MIIKLIPQQIPHFWEAIKHATTQADEIDPVDRPAYLNKLLHSLLNDKSQCFVRLSSKKVLLGLMITKIVDRNQSGQTELHIQSLYSWKAADDDSWRKEFAFIRDFAQHEKCKSIFFESRHPRIQELSKMLGFKEITRVFSLGV